VKQPVCKRTLLLTKIAQKPKVVCYCYRKPIGNGNKRTLLLTKIAQKPKVGCLTSIVEEYIQRLLRPYLSPEGVMALII
jgi:hypothetical protein